MGDKILRILKEIVGDEYASADEAVLYPYSFDLTWAKPRMPDYVVLPNTVEDIQRILRLANRERIPVVPYVSGTNIGGLCIPENGGIIMDLKRMNKIIEINTETGYVVVEPGVTHAQLSAALKKEGFTFSWPVGPPAASVLACAINCGIGHLASKFGINAENISSMEVVLPTGEVAKIGSCAFSDSWHSLWPLPQLAGLFIGWLGTTGIVTKLGVWIYDIPPFIKVETVATDNVEDMARWQRAIRRTYVPLDVTAVSWWLAQVPIPHPYVEKPKDAPEWYCFNVLTAWTEKQMDAYVDLFNKIVKEEQQRGSSVRPYPYPEEALKGRTQLPSRIVGTTKNYCGSGVAGLSWPGTFTPASNWPPLYHEWKTILIKHHFSPAVRLTNFQGAHYGMMRAFVPFDKRKVGDPNLRIKGIDNQENARQALLECVEAGVKYGMIPYKPPVDFWSILNRKADPGFISLLTKVKDMLDPNGIMNPGKLGVR
ncbi:MAG: FAD-binding oxidoreductase [Candidatus Hecatellaceae archaeon]